MTTNPFIEQSVNLQHERNLIIKHGRKFTIKGIYDWEKPINEEVFDMMRQFCGDHRIGFTVRPFEPTAIEEDREIIERLPAYHIYNYEEHKTTIYPGPDCINQMRLIILKEEKTARPKPTPWFSWTLPTIQFRKRPILTNH